MVEEHALRSALGAFPTGVTVVTASWRGSIVGITVNSFTSLSLAPPLLLWCIKRGSLRYPAFAEAERYTISVLAEGQAELCRAISRRGALEVDSDVLFPSATGVPAIAGAVSAFECDAHAVQEQGDHAILIGKVSRIAVGPAAASLVFHKGRFSTINLNLAAEA